MGEAGPAAAAASLFFLTRRHSAAAATSSGCSFYSFPLLSSLCATLSTSSLFSAIHSRPPRRSSSFSPFLSSSFSFFSLSSSSSVPSTSFWRSSSPCSPAAALRSSVWLPVSGWRKQLLRRKTDSRYKGKRCMSPTAGALPAEAAKLSLFEKQKRALEAWLAAEQQRLRALPVQELREAAAAQVLHAYKQKLEQLYGPTYVQREWRELFLLAKASLLETPAKNT